MSFHQRGRQLLPGQASRIHVFDVAARSGRPVFRSDSMLVEAPNVLDADTLLVNADGGLWLLPIPDAGEVLDESSLVAVPACGLDEANNDHVLDRSRRSVIASGKDGDLYRVPLPGGGDVERLTDVDAALPVVRKFYLHDVSADGATFAAIIGEKHEDGAWNTDVALVDAATGEAEFVTRDAFADDGCTLVDGDRILFNTERFSPGTAQLAAVAAHGGEPVRITDDERVNWFPHLSPGGEHLLYLSYEPGVQGHPENQRVELRLLPGAAATAPAGSHRPETIATLFGGQGTINVPPWSEDGTWFAYCDYPR